MKLVDIFEQPMQGKVTRVAGDNVEISDPKETRYYYNSRLEENGY